MTLENFNNLIEKNWRKGTLHSRDGKLDDSILRVLRDNQKELRKEFFRELRENLAQNDFEKLNSVLGFLAVSPLETEDYPQFEDVLYGAMEKLTSHNGYVDIAEMTDFIWTLLDHSLRQNAISDKQTLKIRLANFRSELSAFESRYPAKVSLLCQKIGQYKF